ncbi:MAG: 13E12 repeat family protein, partial [Actinomycetota bacterium]|nr:13E12 repeat family protein [Actinomycetota bacterium]
MFASEVSIDQLEQQLVAEERTIAQIRARQAVLVSLLEGTGVAALDGCRTMVEWVASRLDVCPETARDLLRVARSQEPEELSSGEVSFDRAVEEGRLRSSGATELELERSRGFDICGLRRLVAQHHRLSPRQEQEVFDSRYVWIQPNLDLSSWRLWGEFPAQDGQVVEKALHQRADQFPPAPEGRPRLPQRMADALTSVCQDSLDQPGAEAEGSSSPLVTVFVDATLAGPTKGEGGMSVEGGPRGGTPGAGRAALHGKGGGDRLV